MTHKEAEKLQIGQRVLFIEDKVLGKIIDKGYRAITVQWDDGQTGQVAFADAETIQQV